MKLTIVLGVAVILGLVEADVTCLGVRHVGNYDKCCNGVPYNTQDLVRCCAGKVVEASADANKCCGGVAYDNTGTLGCCGGGPGGFVGGPGAGRALEVFGVAAPLDAVAALGGAFGGAGGAFGAGGFGGCHNGIQCVGQMINLCPGICKKA